MVRRYGAKPTTQKHNRTAVLTLITLREDLASLNIGSLARSYGLDQDVITTIIEQETKRRSAQAS